MDSVTISALYQYPVKSCRGITVDRAELDRFGLKGDRRWLMVDADGRFQTQREHPQLALLQTGFNGETLTLTYKGDSHTVAVPGAGAPRLEVLIWNDRVSAARTDDIVSQWLSEKLGIDLHLVYMPEDSVRRVGGSYATRGETVSFADGFPLLLISQASLDDLNSRLQNPVPMDRFRPNIVVESCEPFAEDNWRQLRCGDLVFDVVKPCSRCVIPSIDQTTGERDRQINRVLASFRRRDGVIYFGQNLLYRGMGMLSLGDVLDLESA